MLGPNDLLETIRKFPVGLWLGLGGAIAFSVVYILETRRRGLDLIARWAIANRFELITAKRRAFVPRGGQWKGFSFFRVRVRDAVTGTRDCWLRFRDWAKDPTEIEVFWDAKA